jgi:hypothetical protein
MLGAQLLRHSSSYGRLIHLVSTCIQNVTAFFKNSLDQREDEMLDFVGEAEVRRGGRRRRKGRVMRVCLWLCSLREYFYVIELDVF